MKRSILIVILAVILQFTAVKAQTYDICIYGETASGVMAAVQAARMGKKTILISTNSHIGGVATSGLTATDMNRNDMVGGVAKEFYGKIYEYYFNPQVWKNQDRESFMVSTLKRTYRGKNDERRIQWVYESNVAERIMRDMLKESGAEVVYNSRLNRAVNATKKGNRITAIKLENGKQIKAKMYIDATYEGDLLDAAGVNFIVGRESNDTYGETMNGVRINYLQGTDLSAIDPYVKQGDKSSGLLPYVDAKPWGEQGSADGRSQAFCYRMTLTNDPANRVKVEKPAGYNPMLHELMVRMILNNPEMPLQKVITLTPMPNKKTDTNHLDFFGASYDYTLSDYAIRKQIEQLHKDYALGMLWTLEHDVRIPEHIRSEMSEWGLPKDEFTDSGNFPYQIYVREGRRMVGQYVMKEQNIVKEGRQAAEHSVGLGSYALDCHYVSRVVDTDGKLRNEGTIFSPTTPYPISYYSLTPKAEQCENLLVPICLSASHVAFSSIRMEPVYMILGQSAATAASIAIDDKTSVQNVSYDKLRTKLLEDGQIISTTK